MDEQDPDTSRRRAWWRSRRGMLEIDVFLVPFIEECFAQLPLAQQEAYERLLESEDTDLHHWLTGKSQPADAELAALVEEIRRHAADRAR